jgi:hypothetical protein
MFSEGIMGYGHHSLKQNSMENLIVDRYMRFIDPLPLEVKLELISRLFENLRTDFSKPSINKEKLLDELYGSWSDMDDSLVENILGGRTLS